MNELRISTDGFTEHKNLKLPIRGFKQTYLRNSKQNLLMRIYIFKNGSSLLLFYLQSNKTTFLLHTRTHCVHVGSLFGIINYSSGSLIFLEYHVIPKIISGVNAPKRQQTFHNNGI